MCMGNRPMANPTVVLSGIVVLAATLGVICPSARGASFNFSSFHPNDGRISCSGNGSALESGVVELCSSLQNSVGRVIYSSAIPLWDADSGTVANFTTHFRFLLEKPPTALYGYGDGLAFFIAAVGSRFIPDRSEGGWLGLVSPSNDGNSSNQIVAVEFDTFANTWDPGYPHVAVDVNTVQSGGEPWDPAYGDTWEASVAYDASLRSLSVSLSAVPFPYPASAPSLNLSRNVDLCQVLPPAVVVGFSASTGYAIETHRLLSWDFTSSPL